MRKILFLASGALSCLILVQYFWKSTASTLPLVVITQIIDHDALNHEREGILAALKDAGYEEGKTIAILYKNAQGNISTAQQVANDFVSRKPAVAVGISTPSAQSLIIPMGRQNIPVVFSAVTDPLEAKLVSQLDAPRPENVTGVSDRAPVEAQMELLQQLVPQAKSIGVLYNPGEANSAIGVEELRSLAARMGLVLIPATTANTADTIAAAQSLIGKVDVIFIPNDNTVMASIASVIALASDHKIPVFNPDFDAVEQGIVAVRACSHKTMGYKAGQMVVKILKGEKASGIPVVTNHPLDLAINTASAEKIGIAIPEDLKRTAKLVP